MHVTPLFISLHWIQVLDNAQCIKFKALMFAYRTTSGSAPLYLNSVPMCPIEAGIQQVNDALLYHLKETQNHFHRLINELFSSGDLPNSILAAESLPSSRNTSLPSLFDPLALSIIIIFYISILFLFKHTHIFDHTLSSAYLFSNC